MRKFLIMLVIILAVSLTPSSAIHAQTTVKCGDIVEGEFTKEAQAYNYVITLAPGDQLSVSVKAIGDTLRTAIAILTPTGEFLTGSNGPTSLGIVINRVLATPSAQTSTLSGRGDYTIVIANSAITSRGEAYDMYRGGTGIFSVGVGCKLRDGTVINPGDTIPPTQPAPSNLSQPPTFGFPGLAPVDFKDALELSFIEGQPIVAAIVGKAVFMSKLTATAGETYTVSVVRSSGTASLGLTVLDPTNVAVFNVAMGTMDNFTANIKITTDGIYTLGFYNAPLVAGGENTAGAYTITVTKQ